jgi:hypothetical protein
MWLMQIGASLASKCFKEFYDVAVAAARGLIESCVALLPQTFMKKQHFESNKLTCDLRIEANFVKYNLGLKSAVSMLVTYVILAAFIGASFKENLHNGCVACFRCQNEGSVALL